MCVCVCVQYETRVRIYEGKCFPRLGMNVQAANIKVLLHALALIYFLKGKRKNNNNIMLDKGASKRIRIYNKK